MRATKLKIGHVFLIIYRSGRDQCFQIIDIVLCKTFVNYKNVREDVVPHTPYGAPKLRVVICGGQFHPKKQLTTPSKEFKSSTNIYNGIVNHGDTAIISRSIFLITIVILSLILCLIFFLNLLKYYKCFFFVQYTFFLDSLCQKVNSISINDIVYIYYLCMKKTRGHQLNIRYFRCLYCHFG